jgi:hypothetical protein
MKVAQKSAAREQDPRAIPMPLVVDDAGLARAVRDAPTPDAAWSQLGFPGGRADVDPAVLATLLTVATQTCTTSDQIGKGLTHFGDLPTEEDPPDAWVDRMVELYVQELEQFWRLDELAWLGLRDGGWTATEQGKPPPEDDPVARIATRSRWQAEPLKPKEPALWFDKLDRLLTKAETPDDARLAGTALVAAVTHHRFSHWSMTRGATT